ncbi:MAG TPA: acyltransferase [Pedobacter sp.]|jgi:acetyltransferase-like isoleucine patch superfamily enzyme
MRQNKLTLLRNRLAAYSSSIRRYRYKCLGLKIGTGGSIGKIGCAWSGSVEIGSYCTIEHGVDFKVDHPFSDDNSIIIGDRTFIGRCCEFHSSTKIIIGDDCLIASQCILIGVGHEYSLDTLINEQPTTVGDIIIENDVWIGTRCTILPGLIIGRGSIIGAGSVVNRSIPEYEIWAGSPARFIKRRQQ